MRVGIFSGTFDPVHKGHIAFCTDALKSGQVDRVVLLPEREPREKQGVTAFEHRMAMLRLAMQSHPALSVDSVKDKQFSVTSTLPELQKRYGDALTLLVGSDVIGTFLYRWPGLDQLLDTVDLLVALRRDDSAETVAETLRQLGRPVRYQCLVSPHLDVASSAIRKTPWSDYLAPEIQSYITKHQLYAANS